MASRTVRLAVLSLPPLRTVAEVAPHAGDNGAPFERLLEHVDVAEVFGRQFCQRAAVIVRNGELGGQNAGEAQFSERVGALNGTVAGVETGSVGIGAGPSSAARGRPSLPASTSIRSSRSSAGDLRKLR
jgi:hypothetical protein